MTKITESSRRTTYQPTTPTTVFPVGFPLFDNDDLRVTLNDEPFLSFTVSATYINGVAEDAAINVAGAGIAGDVLIEGYRLPRRTDQYKPGAPLKIEDHNYSLNRIEVTLQELRRDSDSLGEKAARFPKGYSGSLILPYPDRTKVLGWSEDERAIVNKSIAPSEGIVVGEFGADLVGSDTKESAREKLGIIPSQDYETLVGMASVILPEDSKFIRTSGFHVAADGGGALYRVVTSEPSHPAKQKTGDSRWLELAETMPTLRQFGAVGGGADDTESVNGAMTYLAVKGGALVIDGVFRFTERIVRSIANGKPVSIVGRGRDVSELICDGSGVGFMFSLSNGVRDHGNTFTIRDLSLTTTSTNPATSGYAIQINGGWSGGMTQSGANLENIIFQGANSNCGWGRGIYLNDAAATNIVNCYGVGKENTTVMDFIYIESSNDATDHYISMCRTWWTHISVYTEGKTEGVNIVCNTFVVGEIGVQVNNSEDQPLVNIRGNHIAAFSKCVVANYLSQSVITDNLFYDFPAASAEWHAVLLNNTKHTIIKDNIIYGWTLAGKTRYGIAALSCDRLNIGGNIIWGAEVQPINNGIVLNSSTTNCVIDDTNIFGNVTTKITNSGPSNYVKKKTYSDRRDVVIGAASDQTQFVSIPAGYFDVVPRSVLVQVNDGPYWPNLIAVWQINDAGNSATQIAIRFITRDGSIHPGGTVAISVIIEG
ncbi:hypothetical protein ACJKIH_02950 [Brucella pseudogrignonensis]|uniref:hypothetical protein n=1 Tax=Brucella pseudogrignonensis TaxID=419475 RepID=UPI0038B54A72